MRNYNAQATNTVAILKRPENIYKEYATLWDEIGLKGMTYPNSQIENLLISYTMESGLMCSQVANRLLMKINRS